ncbi:hypothetical protein MMC10_006978 [Thelotrema lepadinum]|nr:hypothetical protein [Thelotrema lepadinum]
MKVARFREFAIGFDYQRDSQERVPNERMLWSSPIAISREPSAFYLAQLPYPASPGGLCVASAKFDMEQGEARKCSGGFRPVPARLGIVRKRDRWRGNVLHRNCASHNDLPFLSGSIQNSSVQGTQDSLSEQLITVDRYQASIPILVDQRASSTVSSDVSLGSGWSAAESDVASRGSDIGLEGDAASLKTRHENHKFQDASIPSFPLNYRTREYRKAVPWESRKIPIKKATRVSNLTKQLSVTSPTPECVMDARDIRRSMLNDERETCDLIIRIDMRKDLLHERLVCGHWKAKSKGTVSSIETLTKRKLLNNPIEWDDIWNSQLKALRRRIRPVSNLAMGNGLDSVLREHRAQN